MRRRLYFVHKRAELFSHIQNTNTQYNLEPIGRRIDEPANRQGLIEHFAEDTSVQVSIAADLVTLETPPAGGDGQGEGASHPSRDISKRTSPLGSVPASSQPADR